IRDIRGNVDTRLGYVTE
ncbi:hypothetical protein, partial [Leucobacter sp. M11]